MNQKREKKFSFTIKNDLFEEIQTEEEASSLTISPIKNRYIIGNYNIKSSIFRDKSLSTNDIEEASRFSRNDVSTNISEVKKNDISDYSKIEDSDKSSINCILLILLFRLN